MDRRQLNDEFRFYFCEFCRMRTRVLNFTWHEWFITHLFSWTVSSLQNTEMKMRPNYIKRQTKNTEVDQLSFMISFISAFCGSFEKVFERKETVHNSLNTITDRQKVNFFLAQGIEERHSFCSLTLQHPRPECSLRYRTIHHENWMKTLPLMLIFYQSNANRRKANLLLISSNAHMGECIRCRRQLVFHSTRWHVE